MPSSSPTNVEPAQLMAVLRGYIRSEVTSILRHSIDHAVGDAITEIRTTVDEKLSTLAATGGPSVEREIDRTTLLEIVPELCSSPAFQTEIRKQLESAFQGVLPGVVQRLRGALEKQLQSGEVSQATTGGSLVSEVLNSDELKELLEDRFRTMLTYLKQEVIPTALGQRH